MTSIRACFTLRYAAEKNGFSLDVDLDLSGRGVTGIFGPSGSGKTTLLRCIAGLQRATRGRLTVNGDVWQDASTFLPTHQRPLGYVFQESSLFPHLTAEENLRYAVKRAATPGHPLAFDRAVSLLGLDQMLSRYPHQLSGGERQRVAIARALLIGPRLLLMDEPLASLDRARKQEFLPYLERLRRELDIPVLYVSHAADEIARLSDHLVVLESGRVVADGPPNQVLTRLDGTLPLGEDAGAIVEVTVVERDSDWHLARVAFPGGELWVPDSGDALHQSVRLRILAKDVSLALVPHRDTSIVNVLAGTIDAIADDTRPAMCLVRVRVGESVLLARVTRRSVAQLPLNVGQSVWVQIKSVAMVR